MLGYIIFVHDISVFQGQILQRKIAKFDKSLTTSGRAEVYSTPCRLKGVVSKTF